MPLPLSNFTILLDVDGVLADFGTPAYRIVEEVSGAPAPRDKYDFFGHLTEEQRAACYAKIHEPGWCAGLRPYDGAVDAVGGLREVGHVYFVTAPMRGRHWCGERIDWLREHFAADYSDIVITSAKHLCKGDVFIDDNGATVDRWDNAHPNGHGIVWAAPYNAQWENTTLRTDSWHNLILTVKGIADDKRRRWP